MRSIDTYSDSELPDVSSSKIVWTQSSDFVLLIDSFGKENADGNDVRYL